MKWIASLILGFPGLEQAWERALDTERLRSRPALGSKDDPRMKSKSEELRDAVKKRLISFILSRGFQEDKRDIYKHDPYGHQTSRFLRWNGDRLELLNIQFDKHGRAKFVLNFGVAPPEGVDDYLGHHAQLGTDISNIPKHARLYAGNPYLMRWFGFPLLKFPVLRNRSSEDVVAHAIMLFPQVEAR